MNGFGTDTLCIDDIRTGRMARGIAVVAQRVYHRLITPRGALLNAGDFGFDIAGQVGKIHSPDYATVLESKIVQEVTKDDAVDVASCMVSVDVSSLSRVALATVTCITSSGPFTLVLRVDDVTVELLRMGGAS